MHEVSFIYIKREETPFTPPTPSYSLPGRNWFFRCLYGFLKWAKWVKPIPEKMIQTERIEIPAKQIAGNVCEFIREYQHKHGKRMVAILIGPDYYHALISAPQFQCSVRYTEPPGNPNETLRVDGVEIIFLPYIKGIVPLFKDVLEGTHLGVLNG